MKQCSKCKQLKELNEFYNRKSNPDGKRTECKECEYKRQKEYTKNNPDLIKKWAKDWRENNPEKLKEKKKKYYYKYKEKLLPKMKENAKKRFAKYKKQYGLGIGTIQRFGFKLGLEVYERFNRECQKCGSKEDLAIHHIDRNGRNLELKGLKANNNIENLTLLCRSCHGRLHANQRWHK